MSVNYSSIWCVSRITTCASHQFRRHHSDEIGIAFGRWARNWDHHRLRRKAKQSFCSVNICVFGHPSTVSSAVDYRHLKKFFFTFDDNETWLIEEDEGPAEIHCFSIRRKPQQLWNSARTLSCQKWKKIRNFRNPPQRGFLLMLKKTKVRYLNVDCFDNDVTISLTS